MIAHIARQRAEVGVAVNLRLERGQIVFLHAVHHGGEHVGHDFAGMDVALLARAVVRVLPAHAFQERGGIHRFGGDGERIAGQRFLFHAGNVAAEAVRQRQNQRDADDADGAGEGHENRARLLGEQVVERQGQRREERHAWLFHLALRRGRFGLRFGGHGIVHHAAVQQPDDARGIRLRQLRVVRNHDHQPVAGDFLQKLHHLHAGFAVQRAGGFVSQQHVRVVDQRARNRHALHLPAGHLRRLLVKLVAQTHALQRFLGARPALGAGNARQRQRQLDVGQHRLMRNQVVALKHKADGVVAVRVPVLLGKVLCGLAANHQIAGGGVVETADQVQKRRLAASGRPEDRYKFIFPKSDGNAVQRLHALAAGSVFLFNANQTQHGQNPSNLSVL